MKFKWITLTALLLLAVLTVGAASAADDAGEIAVDDAGDEQAVEAPVSEAGEDSLETPSGDDVMEDDDSLWEGTCVVNYRSIHYDNNESTVIIMHWPENTTSEDQYINIHFEGDLIGVTHLGSAVRTLHDLGDTRINGSGNPITRIHLGEMGLGVNNDYTSGDYGIVITHDSIVLKNFTFQVSDRTDAPDYFRPGEYSFEILKTEVDAFEDYHNGIFRFEYPYRVFQNKDAPDTVYTSLPLRVEVICDDVWNGVGQDTSYEIERNGTDFVIVTPADLGITEPGKYTIIASAFSVVSKFDLKVTDNFTAEDFIDFASMPVDKADDIVCGVIDPTRSGLNGTVTVYVDGVQAYSKNLVAGQNEYAGILLSDLNATLYNGNYTIKVVYKKENDMLAGYELSDGKTFTSEGVVTFSGISDEGNIPTTITASGATVTYGEDIDIVATLKDAGGNPIAGADVYISVMGVKYSVPTDENGQVRQSVANLPAGEHNMTFSLEKNPVYRDSSKSVKVIVKKSAPKLKAKNKSFKKSDKTKKYSVSLKDANGIAMQGVKVTVKVNKKTYTAVTTKKGVATFKLKKLTKKGKYSAKVKSKATEYCSSGSAKVRITVK